MRLLKPSHSQHAAVFLTLSLRVCHVAAFISIQVPSRSLSRSVQDDVFFSVDVRCSGAPTILWTFTSESSSRAVASWQQGAYPNVSADYSGRVQTHLNGSLTLLELQLQDAGVYLLTVAEDSGSSKDAVLLLEVKEVLYEDLQYLSVSALALACVAALLMLTMWLLDKLYGRVVAWKCSKHVKELGNDATELQRL
ncbi:V-set and transmembrane domain-containing protein 5 isoform X2 [Nelusetta ayraudi]|uniref:V-set and transmembrane domain-containing protein 5 isoform X2 n=1 Tax=Nelusetta ayraudi TaxID=303726 RepID=UPI003F6F97BC